MKSEFFVLILRVGICGVIIWGMVEEENNKESFNPGFPK